ncbi:MAG TPA: hypothetical protein ENJ78_00415 [candidate division WWE3 bacterium]|uniref:Tetratricopeptide repeat protein n=1 Tax=candidate division WWE3 bacterium TaxID=2053526 RepID=A0A7V5J025_UNCKA|nr:hypothetical protein [candidate division WWE3 bacterium]
MKAFILLLLFISLPAYSGWVSSIFKVGLGVQIGLGINKSIRKSKEEIKVEKANSNLWEMHVLGEYEEGFEELRKYLEKSAFFNANVSFADTVAWTYFDNGNYKKSLDIYKSKIIPWILEIPIEKKEYYEDNYKNMKKYESCFFIGCDDIKKKAIKNSIDDEEKEEIKNKIEKRKFELGKRITEKMK